MKPARQVRSELARDAVPLAAELARALEGFISYYQEIYSLSREEAAARVRDVELPALKARLADPQRASWIDLGTLAEKEPDEAAKAWAALRARAREEIESGHRAAKVISRGFDFGPFDRSRFLVVRAALREEWQPSVGSESALIDMLAQIQVAWEDWLGRHLMHANMDAVAVHDAEREAIRRRGGYLPPRIDEVDWLVFTGTMADRFNRMYLRTLRALRDLRRMAPQVVVQNAGQVNVGEKQINVQRD